jgi:ABC-2 type transport system ATP-binding protein
MVALLGPNGAGKSTLFQLLTGLFVADSGSVEVLGADMRQRSRLGMAQLGVVFQQPALDLNLSVRRSLQFHADLHGLPRSVGEPRIDDAAERFGLRRGRSSRRAACPAATGARSNCCGALLHEPRLLLMDEATVGLDPASRAQLLDEVLRARAERGLGVLWATHLVDEAERAQRVVVLHRGKVRLDGTAAALCASAGRRTLQDAFLQLTGGDDVKDIGQRVQLGLALLAALRCRAAAGAGTRQGVRLLGEGQRHGGDRRAKGEVVGSRCCASGRATCS